MNDLQAEFNLMIDGWGISYDIAPREHDDEHWRRYWLGAARQQAITWANDEPDLSHHMASHGHNELTIIPAWISNHIPSQVWDEITYSPLNFNSAPLKFGNGLVISSHTL